MSSATYAGVCGAIILCLAGCSAMDGHARVNPERGAHTTSHETLVKNGAFVDGMNKWTYWGAAQTSTVTTTGDALTRQARITNPGGKLAGLSQHVNLVSGAVYRFGARVKSPGDNRGKVLGARVAIWHPPQKEHELVWMHEFKHWWRKHAVFTNRVTGMATVLIHLGYGNAMNTADFTDVTVERLTD